MLDQFPSFCSFKKHGHNLGIKYHKASQLSPVHLSWAYHLCEQNMHTMYEDVWGWKAPEKQKELKHPDARYLIVYDEQGHQLLHDGEEYRVAYVHFRYLDILTLCKCINVKCCLVQKLNSCSRLEAHFVRVCTLAAQQNLLKHHHQQPTSERFCLKRCCLSLCFSSQLLCSMT